VAVNSKNIDDILTVVEDCSKLNLTITFQVYSPTADYTEYLDDEHETDHRYIQGEDSSDNLVLTEADDVRAEAAISAAIDAYPDVVVFTKPLARWLFARPGVFPEAPLDGKPPKHCLAANDKNHRHTLIGGELENEKTCGHASINCRTCRLYTSIFTEYLREKLNTQMTEQDAMDFLDVHDVFDFVYNGHRRAHWSTRFKLDKQTLA